jgi:cytochrome c biogenesis protein CcmG/thiol:disulfide interchange protein DsbE
MRSSLAASCWLLAVVLTACGAHLRSAAPGASRVEAALKGSPPPLAALHAQANQLLAGGAAAFESQLSRLRGYPVVVNKWASWCGPCQAEFPAFQRAALAYGRRVAFVGLDGNDHDPAAVAFLRRFPVTYPSFGDPHESIARRIKAATYYPETIYFDARGRIVFEHAGPYVSAGALEADIRQHVLG